MRVCLISREYPPDTGWGGIATFAHHLACGLVELGHDVEVVSLSTTGADSRQDDGGIPIHRVDPAIVPGDLGTVSMCMPYSRYVLRTSIALWRKFIELHRGKPFDVVDTPELLAEGLFPTITAAAPVVIRLYTPHSKFIAEHLHSVNGASFDHQFVAMLERVAMLSADAITSPSDDLADFVAGDLNYPRQLISIIRNPIDPGKFSPEGPRALENGPPRVLFVGRLEETLARSGCQDHVTFIDRVPLVDLPSYYRCADICVVPSVYDNSPYTCLEAMACGRPVVGTSAGGTQEYVVAGECGLIVPPRDSQALGAAIATLLGDPQLRARMGAAARQRVLDCFQRKTIASQTAALYEKAGAHFKSSGRALYLKDPSCAFTDAATFLYAFDRMLYDLLYQESWRFRLRHWWRLGSRRPRLFAGKLALRACRALVAIYPGRGGPAPDFVARLEQAINCKQEDPLARLLELETARTSH
jgi:glycogen synthase